MGSEYLSEVVHLTTAAFAITVQLISFVAGTFLLSICHETDLLTTMRTGTWIGSYK